MWYVILVYKMGHDFYFYVKGAKINIPHEIRVGYGGKDYFKQFYILSIHGHSGKSISKYATKVIDYFNMNYIFKDDEDDEFAQSWINRWKNVKIIADEYPTAYFISDCIDYRAPDDGYDSDGKLSLKRDYDAMINCANKLKCDIDCTISSINHSPGINTNNLVIINKIHERLKEFSKYCMCGILTDDILCPVCGKYDQSDDDSDGDGDDESFVEYDDDSDDD